MSPRDFCRRAINKAFGAVGLRVVNSHWGPRGAHAALARAAARGFSPSLIFDVGAYDGRWTVDCQRIFPDSHYVLIDPLTKNRGRLTEMAELNDRVTFFSGIAGPVDGPLAFFDNGDQSSVLQNAHLPGLAQPVESIRIDSLFEAQAATGPVLLKADVQGYELEVLEGASRCLVSTEMLVLEVSFRKFYRGNALAHEVISFVAERGFRIFDVCTYLQRSSDLDLMQSDLIFVHESSNLLRDNGWR